MEDRLASIKEQLRSEETEMLKLIELLKTELTAKTKRHCMNWRAARPNLR